MHIRRRRFFKIAAAVGVLAAAATCRPLLHLARTALGDQDLRESLPENIVDDASRLNRTRVLQIAQLPPEPAAAEAQLAQLLREASTQKLQVAVAGSRHTMGGHTIYPDGIQLNMLPFKQLRLNEQATILHVQAGARWAAVIPYLDKAGLSVGVIQSNNSFSVGGSVNANAHGWQHNHQPLVSTVEACRVMLADGQIVQCSRSTNRELFGLVIGGYGLFGVILDLELRVVSNVRYRLESWVQSSQQYPESYDRYVNQVPAAGMAFGRMDVSPENFLRETSLNVFYQDAGAIPALEATAPGRAHVR